MKERRTHSRRCFATTQHAKRFGIVVLATMIAAPAVRAADGSWSNVLSGGLWSAPLNWTGGTIPDSADAKVDFSKLDIASDNTVSLDSTRTVGSLIFGDINTATPAGWTIDSGGNAANVLSLQGSTPTITVNSLGTGKVVTINATIDGASGLTKAGAGTLVLTGANTYFGGTTISAGTLQIGDGTTNGTIGFDAYSIAQGATLYLNYKTAAAPNWGSITGAGTLRLNSAQAVNGSANWSPALPSLPAEFTGTIQLDKGRIHGGPANLGGTTAMIVADGAQFLAFTGAAGPATFPQNFSISGMGWGETNQNLGALRVSGGMNATFSGNITLIGSAGLYTQSNNTGTINITGIIDGAAGFNLTINAGNANSPITLSNPGNSYAGNTIVNLGALKLGTSNVIPDGAGKGNVTVTSTLDLNTFSETINGLSGTGTVDNVTGSGSPVLTVGNNDATASFSGVIKNTTGTLNFVKTGTGTQTLAGTSTYSGTTSVNNGALLLNGGVLSAGSAVTVASGATFGGKGTAGTVTVNAGGVVQGSVGGTGNLSLSKLTFNGNSALNFTPASGTTAQIAVSGAVTTSGIETINILGSPLPNGSYRLLSYGSIAGSLSAFTLGATPQVPGARSKVYSLDTTTAPGSYLALTVVADSVIWTGGNNGNWDASTANNWKLASSGNADKFIVGDDVQFNDTTGARNVVISGADVAPGSMVLNNSAGNDYTITGTNGITGLASLVKKGAGTLTIANNNSYTGSSTISGGTLELGNGVTNGVIAGDIIDNAALTFRNATAQSYAGVISGTGSLTKTSGGALTLSGASTYTGATTISNGVLIATTLAANGTASSIGKGLALTLDNSTLRYTGAAAVGASGTFSSHFNRSITVNDGGGTIDVAGDGIVFYGGSLSGSGTLTVLDTSGDTNNRQLLVTGNSSDFTGNIVIGNGSPNSGWIQYRSNEVSPFGSGTITVNGGGVLSWDSGLTAPTLLSNNVVLNGGTLLTQGGATVALSGTITANASTTSFLEVSSARNHVITGSLLGSGNLVERGGSFSVEMRGDSSGFTGTYSHTGAGATIFYTATAASAAASWDIPAGSPTNARFMAGGTGLTYQLGALSGATGLLENLNASSGDSTYEIGALNKSTTFGGVIQDNGGTVAIKKVGTGTLTLTGIDTYTGLTTVSGGTLVVNGSITGSSVLASGGTLGGTGFINNAVTVASGGTLAPGEGIGTLSTGSLTFTGGKLALEIDSTNLNSDQTSVIGDLLLAGGATLDITDLGNKAIPFGQTFTLISYSGTWDGGIFTGHADDSKFNVGANQFRISYNGVSNNTSEVVLQAVPEPSVVLSMLGGVALLGMLRRRIPVGR